MSVPRRPDPAQPVLSLLSSRWEEFWPGLATELRRVFGPEDFVSDLFPFTETDYYNRELGVPISRRIIGFEPLADPERLVEFKLATNELEAKYGENGARLFNLDPGILFPERLVLATGKDHPHRIYLGRGIWADLTLLFEHGGWRTLPWTYPDYASERVQKILSILRERCKRKVRSLKRDESRR
jgi:hypothetical protein